MRSIRYSTDEHATKISSLSENHEREEPSRECVRELSIQFKKIAMAA